MPRSGWWTVGLSGAVIAGLAAVVTGAWWTLAADQVEHSNVSFDLSPDGERMVFSGADGDLYLFTFKTQNVTRLTRTRGTESAPAFSPDGKRVVYAADAPGSNGTAIFTMRLDNRRSRQLTRPVGRSDAEPRFSPDGKQITFVAAHRHRPYSMGGWTWDQYDVYTMRQDGTGLRRLTRSRYYQASRPNFTRDGKQVIYAADLPLDTPSAPNNLGGSITTLLEVDLSGSNPPRVLTALPRPAVDSGAWATDANLSRDGKLLAFISDREQAFHYDVHVMNRDGSGIRPLGITGVSGYNEHPVFRPDGKSVLFLAGTEANASSRAIFSLWEVDLAGGKPRKLADSRLFTAPGRWRPPSAGVEGR